MYRTDGFTATLFYADAVISVVKNNAEINVDDFQVSVLSRGMANGWDPVFKVMMCFVRNQ